MNDATTNNQQSPSKITPYMLTAEGFTAVAIRPFTAASGRRGVPAMAVDLSDISIADLAGQRFPADITVDHLILLFLVVSKDQAAVRTYITGLARISRRWGHLPYRELTPFDIQAELESAIAQNKAQILQDLSLIHI